MRSAPAVAVMPLLHGEALAEEAPAASAPSMSPVPMTPKDAQNFLAAAPSELRILGDEFRYDMLLPADILFDFDKAELRPDAEPLLQKVKAHFTTHETNQVHVWGHTDSKGTNEYNHLLSQRRAKAVCDWLEREVGGFNMCLGRGEEEPLLPNENPDGTDNPLNRQLNRRVTLSVVLYPDANKMMEEAKKEADAALEGLQKNAGGQ